MDAFYREENCCTEDGVACPNSARGHLAQSGGETRAPAWWGKLPDKAWNQGEMGTNSPHFCSEKHQLPYSPFA